MRSTTVYTVITGLCLGPLGAHAAGGAYIVDDADIGAPGECQVEAWTSVAGTGDTSIVTAPACVIAAGLPVEFAGILTGNRLDSDWSASLIVQAKTVVGRATAVRPGWAVSVAGTFDAEDGGLATLLVNAPITIHVSPEFHVHLNGGLLDDRTIDRAMFSWGLAADYVLDPQVTLIGEVFGFSIGASGNDAPRLQAGIRFTPADQPELDLIYGHNVTGDGADQFTAGVTTRF